MAPPPPAAPPACYAHPDRVAGSVCRRCGRPICPECMREAPVGWQCATCVRQDSRSAPVTRWRPSPVGRSGRLGNSRITPMTVALIVVNVIAYLYEQRHLDYNFDFNPALLPPPQNTNSSFFSNLPLPPTNVTKVST